jgi:hypothetical protein
MGAIMWSTEPKSNDECKVNRLKLRIGRDYCVERA